MRFLLLLSAFLAFAPSLHAQAPNTTSRAVTAQVRVLQYSAGLAASVGVLALMDPGDPGVPIALAPLAGGLAVYGVGRVFGEEGAVGPTLLGAGLGTLPGLALVGLAFVTDPTPTSDDGLALDGAPLTYAAVGALLYVVVPPAAALVGFNRSTVSSGLSYQPAGPEGGVWRGTLLVRF